VKAGCLSDVTRLAGGQTPRIIRMMEGSRADESE
jgi:hypothetical protein